MKRHNFHETSVVRNSRRILVVTAGALLLNACTADSGAEVSSVSPAEGVASFISASGASTTYDGRRNAVGSLPSNLDADYMEFPEYGPENGWGDDVDNGLSFTPRRFLTEFSEGNGSGADTVCEELVVPSNATYVQATTNSEKPAWITFDAGSNIAYLCYGSANNPRDVAVWAGSKDL